ncbi:acireductone synthase [Xanthobacter oligotrophicus]|uniref:acireductone synthase n=1 Tax=Xanthobacter oligotrophicus TaxID=2607286 RepID=UPI0011F15F90|nr:acireductone synthase [Xanthobacter oligotrophicus]MCG5236149.1 acireductone synthase [Xanthobacter oligotrophicus]
MTIRAILTDIEGAAGPLSFLKETLLPYAREQLGAFIATHAEDDDIEEALEEAGRLMGGFSLKPVEAEALLQRWMKQGRNPTPLKIIQGRIWQQGYEAGAFTAEIFPDVAPSLGAWKEAGIRLFTYSSSSELAQRLWLGSAGAELFEGFFDTRVGQKLEEESYKAIAEQLALPAAEILVLSENEDELDAAKAAGLATTRIAREGGGGGNHPVAVDYAAVTIG